MKRMIAMVAILAAAMGCGDDDAPMTNDAGTTDSGTAAVDSGTPVQTDSGTPVQTDGGTMSGDPCTPAEGQGAITTLGCNGAVPGPQENNATFGRCTPGDMSDMFQGSCGAGDICLETVEGAGFCSQVCDPGPAGIGTGGCPTGSRCFAIGDSLAVCFADCNDASECSAENTCDEDGSCFPEFMAPDMDAGMPDMDAGTPDMDAGTPDMDAGTPDMDAGAPEMDAGVPEVDAGE